MKKFIDFLISFALFVTNNYITEDWSTCTKPGKLYYYPFWLIRSIIYWVICPIFIPEYFFKKSIIYKQYKTMYTKANSQIGQEYNLNFRRNGKR